DDHADEDHDYEGNDSQGDPAEHGPDVEGHRGRMAGTAGIDRRPDRPLTPDGLVPRPYPHSSPPRWDVIDSVGIVKAGNRVILAYKLVPDVPPPRHQPARDLLVAVNAPSDGGW